MRGYRLRFSLMALIAMPTMFALGWWVRDRNYERDVYMAAEQVADYSGGVYVPELGMLHGGRELERRMKAMSPKAKAEMARRLAYYEEVMAPAFDPPRPSLLESLTSLFGARDDGQTDDDMQEVRHLGPPSVFDGSHDTIRERFEKFRRMRSSSTVGEPSDSFPTD